MTIQRAIRLAAMAVCGFSTTRLMAGVILPTLAQQPAGSQYQLIFVTNEFTTATSADHFVYDTFAAHEAGQNTGPSGLPSAFWGAVVSTPTTNANVSAPSSGIPVYNTQGIQVAASTLYSGSLLAPVQYDQFGNASLAPFGQVWTGTDTLGVAGGNDFTTGLPFADPHFALGNTLFASPIGTNGNSLESATSPGSGWLADGGADDLTGSFPIYALSSPITVPESAPGVPEPATISLLGSAFFMFGGYGVLRRRRAANRDRHKLGQSFDPDEPLASLLLAK